MGTKKKFTPEELKHLQANPYTLRVTADSISYTLASRRHTGSGATQRAFAAFICDFCTWVSE